MTHKIIALATAAALSVFASGAMAQGTTLGQPQGPSGNPEYPLRVIGENGVLYNCAPAKAPGAAALCVRVGSEAVVAARPSAVGNSTAIAAGAAGLLGIIAIAASSDTD